MEFKFDPFQQFQIDAIESVANLFDGQGKIETSLRFSGLAGGFLGSPNRLDLDENGLLSNLQKVQETNHLQHSSNLEVIDQEIESAEGKIKARFPNFSVEMETGTGKTYVYIRTALELNKRFGFRRFIIVVPSIAIKEGVLKTFQITKAHFQELYENNPYEFYSYDSSNLTEVRRFSSSPSVEFMVMTLDSFNKSMTEESKGNVIKRPTDRLQGAIPIHLIQAVRPILILDEPQNMESERSISALATLNPLLALRYSATHRVPYNRVYTLTPAEAYRQGLVKKIEVASVLKESDANQVFIRLDEITARKNTVAARVTVNKLMKGGAVKEKQVRVKPGDNLGTITVLPDYTEFIVEEINPGSNTLLFSNGVEIQKGESRGADKEAIFEAQIKYSIEEHFRKQRRLRSRGIKVLSLFFIDKVDNYAQKDGIIRKLFNRTFDELKKTNTEWKDIAAEDVQASYFAFSKKRDRITYLDSTSGESEKDREAYDLIMKDKERLLSFDTKKAFVFSHSALREGWDNPNVFQICTLNQTTSDIKKRQEIGRGVRLAVNQNGDRTHDPTVNLLTVVANQSYEQYVDQLQQEIVEQYGEGVEQPPKPANARKRVTIKLRKEWILKPEFRNLWDQIRTKTKYSVNIDTNRLVDETVKILDSQTIKPPRVVVAKARVNVDDKDTFEAIQISTAKTFIDLAGRFPLPNLTDVMSHLLENTTPPVRLSRKTLIEIYSKTKNKQAAIDNPFEFASTAANIIKDKLADFLVEGIQYEKTNDHYEMTLLKDAIESWEDYVIPAQRSIYDKIEYDSETEKQFVEGMEKIEQVKMYVKLPPWFLVSTPVGDYNPDWAIVWEDRDEHGKPTGKPKLYFVRETKSTTNLSKLRPDERRKVICGEKHFKDALAVGYKIVTSPSEIAP